MRARKGALTGSVLTAVLFTSLSACGARRDGEADKKPITETLYELDLTEPLPEQGTTFLGETKPGLSDALLRIRALLDEPLAKGLFVRLGSHQGAFGDVEDLAQALESFRAAKRPVHCHFDELDNAGFALASHCDKLSMTPSGLLNLVGLAAQVVHGRQLLEMIGVRAELLQMGKYKGAAEPFTRDSMSDELRQSLDGLLDDLDSAFRGHLSRRVSRDEKALKALLDNGPYTSAAARTAGLVDAVSYDDEARAKAKAVAGARVVRQVFVERDRETLSLRELFEALAGPEKPEPSDRPELGVAFLTGEIVDGDQATVERSASGPFVKAMRRWGDNNRMRAVVLRIESPGGSALASDRMWHAVRRVSARKPVIVSIGNMAASGGYYVASAGTHILASAGSIVGSIGVVGGKMVISDLAQRVGVHVDTLSRAEHATWLSPFHPFSPGERVAFESMLGDTYQRFLARVAEGRRRTVEQILPAAEGRVMGGERGRSLGLVDEIGGFARALELARQRGKLPKDAPIATWPDASDPLRALSGLIEAKNTQGVMERTSAQAFKAAHTLTAGALMTVIGECKEPTATALPFALRIR